MEQDGGGGPGSKDVGSSGLVSREMGQDAGGGPGMPAPGCSGVVALACRGGTGAGPVTATARGPGRGAPADGRRSPR